MRKVLNELLKENCEFKRKEAQNTLYNSSLIEYIKRAKIAPDGIYKDKLPFNGIYYEIIVKKTEEKRKDV